MLIQFNIDVEYSVKLRDNPIRVTSQWTKIKQADLKSEKAVYKCEDIILVENAVGKVSFKQTGEKKNITVDKDGNVTVKKGLKPGTYSTDVEVTAAGDGVMSDKSTRTITVNIEVLGKD